MFTYEDKPVNVTVQDLEQALSISEFYFKVTNELYDDVYWLRYIENIGYVTDRQEVFNAFFDKDLDTMLYAIGCENKQGTEKIKRYKTISVICLLSISVLVLFISCYILIGVPLWTLSPKQIQQRFVEEKINSLSDNYDNYHWRYIVSESEVVPYSQQYLDIEKNNTYFVSSDDKQYIKVLSPEYDKIEDNIKSGYYELIELDNDRIKSLLIDTIFKQPDNYKGDITMLLSTTDESREYYKELCDIFGISLSEKDQECMQKNTMRINIPTKDWTKSASKGHIEDDYWINFIFYDKDSDYKHAYFIQGSGVEKNSQDEEIYVASVVDDWTYINTKPSEIDEITTEETTSDITTEEITTEVTTELTTEATEEEITTEDRSQLYTLEELVSNIPSEMPYYVSVGYSYNKTDIKYPTENIIRVSDIIEVQGTDIISVQLCDDDSYITYYDVLNNKVFKKENGELQSWDKNLSAEDKLSLAQDMIGLSNTVKYMYDAINEMDYKNASIIYREGDITIVRVPASTKWAQDIMAQKDNYDENRYKVTECGLEIRFEKDVFKGCAFKYEVEDTQLEKFYDLNGTFYVIQESNLTEIDLYNEGSD